MNNEVDAPDVEPGQVKILMQSDGTLYYSEAGRRVPVAKFERASGHLEWVTKEYSEKYYNHVTTKLGTVSEGRQESGVKIKSIAVKGQIQVAKQSNAPKCPKRGILGDASEDIVQWYLDHNLPEAIVRYGIYTDDKGAPIKREVARRLISTVDNRGADDSAIEWVNDGNKSKSKSPIAQTAEFTRLKNQVIARRATQLTYTPDEVVGGFDTDDASSGEVDE